MTQSPSLLDAAPPGDPVGSARVWYEHRDTGDFGYEVIRDGKAAIRYDRPNVNQYTYDLSKWAPRKQDLERYSDLTASQVAYAAFRQLMLADGRPELAKREWLDMTEKQRRRWVEDGPATEPAASLYKAIKETLRGIK